MRKSVLISSFLVLFFLYTSTESAGQCSICTKTAQQMGEKPAQGMNSGIIYLAATPFLIAGYLFYRWKKSNRAD